MRFIALALACALFGAGAEARSGEAPLSEAAPDGAACVKAQDECDKSRATLSDATRDADVKASAYVACTEQRAAGACVAHKRALDQAMAKKRRAQAAYRFAAARRKAACGA